MILLVNICFHFAKSNHSCLIFFHVALNKRFKLEFIIFVHSCKYATGVNMVVSYAIYWYLFVFFDAISYCNPKIWMHFSQSRWLKFHKFSSPSPQPWWGFLSHYIRKKIHNFTISPLQLKTCSYASNLGEQKPKFLVATEPN